MKRAAARGSHVRGSFRIIRVTLETMDPIDIPLTNSTSELKGLFTAITKNRSSLYDLACEKLKEQREKDQKEMPISSPDLPAPQNSDSHELEWLLDISTILEAKPQLELDSWNLGEWFAL
jgi:hypothetical protein